MIRVSWKKKYLVCSSIWHLGTSTESMCTAHSGKSGGVSGREQYLIPRLKVYLSWDHSCQSWKKLVPISQRLSNEDLLKRCTRNKTQNPNESLHSDIWKYCGKATLVGQKTMETAVALATCQFVMHSSFQNFWRPPVVNVECIILCKI